jgi:hypothetical protein
MAEMRDVPHSMQSAALVAPRLLTRRQATAACLVALVSALCTAGLLAAAVLLHPPTAIVPLLVIVCVGCPVVGTWELPPAITALRAKRLSHRREIAMLRRSLDQLPEVEHPLGH